MAGPLPRWNVLWRGGLLLIAGHGSLAPWAWSDPEIQLPKARDVANALALHDWTEVEITDYPREAHEPDGQVVEVFDSITTLERPIGEAIYAHVSLGLTARK